MGTLLVQQTFVAVNQVQWNLICIKPQSHTAEMIISKLHCIVSYIDQLLIGGTIYCWAV